MASARARRRDKQLNTLVQENDQLHKDIKGLENAYSLHRQNVEADQTDARGLIRREIGGSRWEHGGAGKLTTYKVQKPAEELLALDSQREGRASSRKHLNQSGGLNGHRNGNGVHDDDDTATQRSGDSSRRVKAFADTNSEGDNILQECNDKISDLKTKVLKKASSKVIRRESWSNSNDTRNKQKAAEPSVETKPTSAKPVNAPTSQPTKSKGVQRNNLFKNEKAVVPKGSKANGVIGKTLVAQQADEAKANDRDGNQSERLSRRDQYIRNSASKSLSNGDKLEESVPNVEEDLQRQDSGRGEDIQRLSSDVRKSMGMTYTPRKVQPFAKNSKNIFPTQPIETTEIFIDPKSGEVRVKSGTEDFAGNLERHDGTVVLIQPGSARKSSERYKAPCSIVDNSSSQNVQTNVRDIFGLGTFDTVPNTSDASGRNVANLSSSPFTAAKDCNSEVEFWLRGLGLPDVNNYVQIFADNEIDLLDLEFMSAAQLHEMGVTGIGALDKILKGIKDLKSASSRDKKHSSVKTKHLTASSIAWEDIDDDTERKAFDRKLNTLTSQSSSLSKSCHDTNTASSVDLTESRYERCNSALSNASESSQPPFAANTKSSSAKQTDKSKRPPSAKGSGGFIKGTGQAGVKGTNKAAVTGKKTDTTTVDKVTFRGNNLEGKPKKGVLLRPRSSSLNRELPARGQGKKAQGQEEEKVVREPRVRSRSADAVKRKAVEGVQAAAKKFEEKQQKNKDTDRHQPRAELRTRRDKMAARHLQREKTRETSVDEPSDIAGVVVTTAGSSSSRQEEGLESLVTVNIMSTPHSDPRRSVSEDMAKTHAMGKKSELQKSLRRVEPARKSSRSRPTVPQLDSEDEPPLLSTYKIGGRDQGRDKPLSEAESGYKTDTSSTYSQVQDKVSEIQLKIKRLKARATSGDDMTLPLVRDLQGQLKQFERQLSEKERDIRGKHWHKGATGDGEDTSSRERRRSRHRGTQRDNEDRRDSRRSRSRSREPPIVVTATLPQQSLDRGASPSSPSPRPRTGGSTSDRSRTGGSTSGRSSPTKELLLMTTPVTSQRSAESQRSGTPDMVRMSKKDPLLMTTPVTSERSSEGQRSVDPDMVRMSKKEMLHEMKKEQKHHHRQIRQLQTELERIRQNDPISVVELNQKDIIFEKYDVLGEGMFSKVYKGWYQGGEVAIKCLKAPLQNQDKNYFTAEVSLLKELRHPRVVLLVGVCTTSKLPLMVLEFMSEGSLLKLLHDPDRESLDHALYYQIARDVAAGMNYLHSHRPEVLHLDLKSNNILLGQGLRAKIADFGFSKLRHEAGQRTGKKKRKPEKQFPSSLPWMAPELLDKGEVTNKADVYSFGMILWEMVTRQAPYQDCSTFQILEMVRKKKRPEVPPTTPEGLQSLIQDCWDPNPARRQQFKDVIPRLETLAFPPAWRDLFKKAGVPDAALQNLESTRKIIDIVSSTLEGSDKSVVNSFMIRQRNKDAKNAGNQSGTSRETTLTSSRQSSARKEDDEGSNWEAETVSTLSGRLSSDESQITVMNLHESKAEDVGMESSDSDDDLSYLSNDWCKQDTAKKKPTKIDVFIPNLALQLQEARDEFKAERSKIERINDWVDISMEDRSYRSEDGKSQRTSQRDVEDYPGLNLNSLSGRSSRGDSQAHRYVTDGETLDEKAKRKILNKQTKTKDISLYSEEHWMRESLDNRRPLSPVKRSLSVTLSDTSRSSLSEALSTAQSMVNGSSVAEALSSSQSIVTGSSVSEALSTTQSMVSDTVLVATSSESFPRARSRTLGNVDSSKDSFFGIPIHRQAAPTAVMSQESLDSVKLGDYMADSTDTLCEPLISSQDTCEDVNVSHRTSVQSLGEDRASSSILKNDQEKTVLANSDVFTSESRRDSVDQQKSQERSSLSSRSSSFSNDIEHHVSSITKAYTTSKSEDKLEDVAKCAIDTPPVSVRNSVSREKLVTQSTSESPSASVVKELTKTLNKTSTFEKHSKSPHNRSSDSFMKNYLNNSVGLGSNETLGSTSERSLNSQGKPDRESGGDVTKSLESFSRKSSSKSVSPIKVASSFKPEELSAARNKLISRGEQVNSSNNASVFRHSLKDTGKETVKREIDSQNDTRKSGGKDIKLTGDVQARRETEKETMVIGDTKTEKEQVRVKLSPKEVDAKRQSLSESVKLKPIELNARQKPAITPRKSKSFYETRDSVNMYDSITSDISKSLSKSVSLSARTDKSYDQDKDSDGVRVKLTQDSKFLQDLKDVKVIGAADSEQDSLAKRGKEQDSPAKRGKEQDSPAKRGKEQDSPAKRGKEQDSPAKRGKDQDSPAKRGRDVDEQRGSKTKANTIKIKLRRDPFDRMPVKAAELQDSPRSSSSSTTSIPASVIEAGMKEDDNESRKKTSNAKTKKESANENRQDVKSKGSSGSPVKNMIKVKIRKDPMAPKPSLVPSSPVPPAPPPPPPSLSVNNISKSVQVEGNRMSMADEIKLRLNSRQSISEGCRLDNRGNLVGRPSSGARSGGTITEGEATNQNGAGRRKNVLAPQHSEGMPSFVLESVELQGQKENLRSISRPHPDQDELGHVSQEQLSSIADILKKAVMGRRLAMHEGADSVSQSMESTATGWSVDTGI